MSKILFASTAALERALDGDEKDYERYYFALYHCLPDEDNPFNKRRSELIKQYPDKAVPVGRYYVLFGEPACELLRSYYHSLSLEESLPKEFRVYAENMWKQIEEKHRKSQSLPKPIDLSEGQLSEDSTLAFYASLAISNGQVIIN